jgi:type 1 glutamine amidotransferase
VSEAEAAIKPKAAGETKVVALLGNTEWNNGLGHELCIRKIFASKKDWRLIFVRNSKAFTPNLIADADLLITCRAEGKDPIDLSSPDSGVAEKLVEGAVFWTEKNINAIIDNVKNRGMGLIALHNSITAADPKFDEFLDISPIPAHEFEPLWVTRINKEHPITKETGKFLIGNDEQFLVLIKSPSTSTLFETTAIHEKRQGVSGWALERGKGRIVGLLPGSAVHAYQAPEYRNIFWRAAHWAMKRDIQAYPEAQNTLYD